jgi:hypothetical protein
MKKNIFLYLFIFAILINVFTYMFFTNKQKYEDGRIEKMQAKVNTVKDSMKAQTERFRMENYFSLENNDNAKEYYEGQDIPAIAIKVRDGIYAQNINPAGNPLAGYPPMDGRPFTISKIKILNQRWVIVDFSNGMRWGEAIIRYFVEEDGTITYERGETLLHNFKPY